MKCMENTTLNKIYMLPFQIQKHWKYSARIHISKEALKIIFCNLFRLPASKYHLKQTCNGNRIEKNQYFFNTQSRGFHLDYCHCLFCGISCASGWTFHPLSTEPCRIWTLPRLRIGTIGNITASRACCRINTNAPTGNFSPCRIHHPNRYHFQKLLQISKANSYEWE